METKSEARATVPARLDILAANRRFITIALRRSQVSATVSMGRDRAGPAMAGLDGLHPSYAESALVPGVEF